MPDPNSPMEKALRDLHEAIGFHYATTDMKLVRAILAEFALETISHVGKEKKS